MLWGEAYYPDEVLGAYDEILGQDEEDMIEMLGEIYGLYPDEIDDLLGEAERRRGRREGRERPGRERRRAKERDRGRRERRERRERPRRPDRREMAREGMRALRAKKAAERAMVSPAPPMLPTIPGAPGITEGKKILPFEQFATLALATPSAVLTAEPQAQTRGVRLVTVAALNAAAVTAGLLPVLTSFNIGIQNQFLATGFVPFETFGPGAFQVDLELDGAGPGLNVALGVTTIPAATGTEAATVAATLICQSIT